MVLVLAAAMMLPPASGQSTPVAKASSTGKAWAAPRMPDGHPDLQGIWSAATITPLERPAELASKQSFTEAEAAQYEKDWRQRNNMDRRDGFGTEADVGRAYNDFWWDRGTNVVKTRKTSLVQDPPDGRIPSLTAEAQKRVADRAAARKLHPADGPEDRPLSERCILLGTAGTPIVPTAYNNNYQIVQTPDYVVMLSEMIHDARVIPLDGRPHLESQIRQLKGDSRGHWEGDTLVVETTNFTGMTAFRGSGENMRLVERFTRTDANTLLYEFTVNDPASFVKPWTAQIPLWKAEGPIFEYACHEGNYGMTGLLQGARAEEREAARKGSK
jgi:hypothetical protein